MKQAQWTIAALVLAAMVFALTFAVNYLGSGSGESRVKPDDEQPVLVLDFPLGQVYPGGVARLEREENVPGHQDFWFVNRNDQAVTMGLDATNCKCSEVEAFVLPEGPASAEAKRLIDGPAPALSGGWWDLEGMLREAGLEALKGGVTGAKLKKEVPSIDVPAGAVGFVRLHWSGERPGRATGLQAKLWLGSLQSGRLLPLEVRLSFFEAIRVKLASDEATVYYDEDLQQGAKRTFYVWSSTRPSFDLDARLSTTAASPGAEPVEVGKPEPLSPEELAKLEEVNNTDPAVAGALGGRVLSGYRVKVTLRAVSPDGKKLFPVGPFGRRVLLTSRSAAVTDKPVLISGRVEGIVQVISSASVDEGGVNFLTFFRSTGKKESVRLSSDVKGLKLKVDRERTWPNLTATVRPEKTGKDDEGQRWQVVIEVLPGKALGVFPRNQDGYKDTAVYLKALEPGKPPRLVRIAVRGIARDG